MDTTVDMSTPLAGTASNSPLTQVPSRGTDGTIELISDMANNFLVLPPPLPEKRKIEEEEETEEGQEGEKARLSEGKDRLKIFTVDFSSLSSHPLVESEFSLLQKGLNFAPSSNANLFELFKDLHKYICDITVKRFSGLKFAKDTKISENIADISPNSTQKEYTPQLEESCDQSMSNNIDEEAINILEELLLERGSETDIPISTPFSNGIIQSTFRPKSTFYPHHVKNEYIKTFYAMVYADFRKLCESPHGKVNMHNLSKQKKTLYLHLKRIMI